MTLTNDEKKIMRNLVFTNIGDCNEVEKFNFTLKCSECTDEEIDILDTLCVDPSAKTRIADCINLSLDQLLSDEEELTQMHSEIWVSVRYSCVKDEYQISGECI